MSVRRYRNWWHVDLRFASKRYRFKCPENTKRAAERYERIMLRRLQLGLPVNSKVTLDDDPARAQAAAAESDSKQKPTFQAFADEFMQTYAKTNNKPSEQKSKNIHLNCHILPALGTKRLDEIGTRDIEHLKARLLNGTRSRKSVNNIIGTLRRIMSYAVEIELLEKAPRVKALKVEPRQMVFLDFGPYEALIDAAAAYHPMWHAAILLGGDAGLRLGEICALGPEHWDDARARISVHRSIWEGIETTTKGWKRRTVPLTERLQNALRALTPCSRRYMVAREQKTSLTDTTTAYHLEKICKRTGIEPIGWHALRHTFCSHLAMVGIPPRTIQELAGHADLRTTMQYMHLVAGETDRAISLLAERHVRTRDQATE